MYDLYSLSDRQIQGRIGEKIKATRLRQNVTQKSLAESSSISLSSVKKIENGEIASFDSLLRVMRVLGLLDTLSDLCKENTMSPSEYYEYVKKASRHTRKRASGVIRNNKEESEW